MTISSGFNRLVQNTRQLVTRPSRNSAEAATTTLPAEVDVFATSNVLGMFDSNNVPITSTYRPRAPLYHFDLNTQPGPSHFYNYAQPPNNTLSAWTKDFAGQDIYVGHGKIEEVGSDLEESANQDLASPSKLGPLLSLNAGDHESNELINDELSHLSPPPCPKLRRLPSLQPTLTCSDHMSFGTTSIPAITATNAGSSVQLPDDSVEVHLVTHNLVMVESSLEDVQFMNTLFLANSVEHDLSGHLDICAHIEESLESLRGTLTQRTRMGAEEWSVRSLSWHQKHMNRLLSLKRTLQRLARLRQLIETHSLRSHQRTAVRVKLEQHEAKLADLASKYSAAFGRLGLRHLHFLLRQSHDEARDLHRARRSSRESSFERRWAEGKSLRAGLRVVFHDQKNLYYNNKSRLRSRQSWVQ